jgi:hypothetical protein
MSSIEAANVAFNGVTTFSGSYKELSVSELRVGSISHTTSHANVNPIDVSTLPSGSIITMNMGTKDIWMYGLNGANQSLKIHFDLNIQRPAQGQRITIWNDSNAEISLVWTAPVTLIWDRNTTPVSPQLLFNSGGDAIQFAYLYGNGEEVHGMGISV